MIFSRGTATSAFFLLSTSILGPSSAFTIVPPQTSQRPALLQNAFSTALNLQRRGRPRGPVRTIEVKPPMNTEIKYDTLRVTVPNLSPTEKNQNQKDEPLGIMSLKDALAKAKELGGLDVILINENSDPPVAKIVDYSKFRYEKEKKAKELKKNAKTTEVKEVKMSYKIDVHDYGVRIKNASKFIQQGNRVKCTVQFKGREVQHDKLGFELLGRMADDMSKICSMEGKPKREGRNLSCILSPRAEVTKAVNDKKRADEKARKKRKSMEKKEAKEKKDVDSANASKVGAAVAGGTIDLNEDDDEEVGSLDDLLGDDGTDLDIF